MKFTRPVRPVVRPCLWCGGNGSVVLEVPSETALEKRFVTWICPDCHGTGKR